MRVAARIRSRFTSRIVVHLGYIGRLGSCSGFEFYVTFLYCRKKWNGRVTEKFMLRALVQALTHWPRVQGVMIAAKLDRSAFLQARSGTRMTMKLTLAFTNVCVIKLLPKYPASRLMYPPKYFEHLVSTGR